MKKIFLLTLLLLTPIVLANPDVFPLNGLRFVGYEGTDNRPMYTFGFTLLWIVGPIILFLGWGAISGSEEKPAGCLVFLLPLSIFYVLFFLVNFDYFIGFTLGPLILGGSALAGIVGLGKKE